MKWIKVTPDTMPSEMEFVLVTAKYNSGERYTEAEVRYSKKYGWEYLADSMGGYWSDMRGEVTHWMPYPAPAEVDYDR